MVLICTGELPPFSHIKICWCQQRIPCFPPGSKLGQKVWKLHFFQVSHFDGARKDRHKVKFWRHYMAYERPKSGGEKKWQMEPCHPRKAGEWYFEVIRHICTILSAPVRYGLSSNTQKLKKCPKMTNLPHITKKWWINDISWHVSTFTTILIPTP